MLVQAPSLVGLYPKSSYGTQEESRALTKAAQAMLGVELSLPIYYGRKKLGYMIGDPKRDRVLYRATASTINDIDTAMRNGNRWRDTWFKSMSSTLLAYTWYDLWCANNDPPPGSYTGTANTARSFDNTVKGCLWLGSDVSPKTKQLTMLSGSGTTNPGVIILYDRVLAYDNCTYGTSLVTMTNTVTPARYTTTASNGMQLCLTSINGTSATTGVLSALNYTNYAGVSKSVPLQTNQIDVHASVAVSLTTQGGPVVFPWSKNSSSGVGPFISLATGDNGVRNVLSHQWSVADASTFCLFLCRPIAVMCFPEKGVHYEVDYVTNIVNCEPVVDGAHLAFLGFSGLTTTSTTHGYIEVAWT